MKSDGLASARAKGLVVQKPMISIWSYKSSIGSSVSSGSSKFKDSGSSNMTGPWVTVIFFCRKLASQSNVFFDLPVKRKAPMRIRMFNCSRPGWRRSIKSVRFL